MAPGIVVSWAVLGADGAAWMKVDSFQKFQTLDLLIRPISALSEGHLERDMLSRARLHKRVAVPQTHRMTRHVVRVELDERHLLLHDVVHILESRVGLEERLEDLGRCGLCESLDHELGVGDLLADEAHALALAERHVLAVLPHLEQLVDHALLLLDLLDLYIGYGFVGYLAPAHASSLCSSSRSPRTSLASS